MRNLNRLLWLCLLAALLPGCATSSLSTITNLTSSRLPRKENGQYAFSVEFITRQSTLVRDTLRAFVIVGDQRYEMARTPLLPDRWETLVPVDKASEVVTYRYRFEYEYRAIPERRAGVFDSKNYQLYLQAP